MNTDSLGQAYGKRFERQALWLLLHDKEFSQLIADHITSDHFDYAPYQLIADSFNEIISEHSRKRPPSIDTIHADLSLRCNRIRDNSPRKEALLEALEVCDKLSRSKPVTGTDREYVFDRIDDFIQVKRMREALLESADLLADGKIAQIRDVVNDAAISGKLAQNIGIRYKDVAVRMKKYEREQNIRVHSPTDIPLIDDVLNGGLYSKYFGVIIAPQGRGKTMALIHIGAAALLRGYTVVHITLELDEIVVAQRYDGRLTGIAINELANKPERYKNDLVTSAKQISGNLYIKEWGTNEASALDIRSYLKLLERTEDIKPDVLLVDYAALLKPYKQRKELRLEMGDTARELRQIAKDFNCAVWTASQVTKEGQRADMPDMSQAAETSEIINVADFVMLFGQTIAEKKRGRMRWFIGKNRIAGHVGRTVDVAVDEATQLFTQTSHQTSSIEDVMVNTKRKRYRKEDDTDELDDLE